MDPELVSPHRASITSLAVDAMGRFVLAGSADGSISVYDLSYWGSEEYYNNNNEQKKNPASHHQQRPTLRGSYRRFRPVARSIKAGPRPLHTSLTSRGTNWDDPAATLALEVPSGHRSALTHVQWYPVDTGAFVSSASDGSLLLWDTNKMEPVLQSRPFHDTLNSNALRDTTPASCWLSAHLQTGGDHSLVATGSWQDSALKLVDLKSGASSHQLIGHSQGITALQWSPTMPLIVCSGSKDGSIRLWDIRKSGSQACVAILRKDVLLGGGNRQSRVEPPYQADYSHLRQTTIELERRHRRRKQSKRRRLSSSLEGHSLTPGREAPNNYDHVQRRVGAQDQGAHNGHVAGLAFLQGGQQLASVGGADGALHLWDLRYGPILRESKFVAPGGLEASTPRMRRAALTVDSENRLWLGHHSHILGFSREGGSPQQVLQGHLTTVTSMSAIRPDKYLLTGSKDGMILSWGRPKHSVLAPKQTRLITEDRDNW